jgi:hypothetical protein
MGSGRLRFSTDVASMQIQLPKSIACPSHWKCGLHWIVMSSMQLAAETWLEYKQRYLAAIRAASTTAVLNTRFYETVSAVSLC